MGRLQASNSEHLPVFMAEREGEGRSAPVHRCGTLRPRSTQKKKNCMGWGQTTHTVRQTSWLLDQIGPVGLFGE